MDIFQAAWEYALARPERFWAAMERHLYLVGIVMVIALAIGVPLGIWSARSRVVAAIAINLVNGLRVLPSLAVLFLFLTVPGFGIGMNSALVALTFLALPPIVINTDAAFRKLDPAIREAALGMGLPPRLRLWRVEFPLALPVIIAGVRTALVEVIASATLAAFIGAGGLGDFIVLGFNLNEQSVLLVGAIPIALMVLLAELAMGQLQRWASPPAASR